MTGISETYGETDPKEIVRLSKEIFGTTICGDCRAQLVPAYQKLTAHFREQGETMAKKVIKKESAPGEKPVISYKLRSEFKGARHVDGKRCIELSDVDLKEVEEIFTPTEITEYFERID